MNRHYPKTKTEKAEFVKYNVEPWMIECLALNPSYVSWGNGEDYMSGKKEGWDGGVEVDSFSTGKWRLDELNELVNFYFYIDRKSIICEACDQSGLNPETKKLSDSWYEFDNPSYVTISPSRRFNNNAWSNHITDHEVLALMKEGRLCDFRSKEDWHKQFDEKKKKWFKYSKVDGKSVKQWCDAPVIPSAEEVNQWNRGTHPTMRGMGHDSINQWICVKHRATTLGVYGKCTCCGGEGVVYTEEKGSLNLQVWMIHPRKGCSRGVIYKNITKDELPEVYKYLREANARNTERFSKIKKIKG